MARHGEQGRLRPGCAPPTIRAHRYIRDRRSLSASAHSLGVDEGDAWLKPSAPLRGVMQKSPKRSSIRAIGFDVDGTIRYSFKDERKGRPIDGAKEVIGELLFRAALQGIKIFV